MNNSSRNLIGRARVREAINALQAARELSFVHVGGRVMLQVSSLQAQQPLAVREIKPRAEVRSASATSGHAAGRAASGESQRRPRKPDRSDQDTGKNERAAQVDYRH